MDPVSAVVSITTVVVLGAGYFLSRRASTRADIEAKVAQQVAEDQAELGRTHQIFEAYERVNDMQVREIERLRSRAERAEKALRDERKDAAAAAGKYQKVAVDLMAALTVMQNNAPEPVAESARAALTAAAETIKEDTDVQEEVLG